MKKLGGMCMLKKKLSFILSVVLSTSLLVSGCGQKTQSDTTKDANPTDSTKGTTEAPTTANQSGNSVLPIVKDKLTLKILCPSWSGIEVGNAMPVLQELEKRTNIHLDFNVLPATNPAEKFNIIMASGDLPDIISYTDKDAINKYGMEGALISVQDLINKHAPNIKKALDNPLEGETLPYRLNPWSEIAAIDGNTYTIPILTASNSTGPIWGIRTDWLDKLGLKMPETIDELYTALKAFKEKDPNGNGKADEIPFVAGLGNKINAVMPIINSFGAHMNFYVDKKDDTIKYGPVEKQYKAGLEFLNKLYTEGLLEKDYMTSTRDQWLAKTTSNQAGLMFVSPAGGFGPVNIGLKKLDPNFIFMPVKPFKGADGQRYKDTAVAGGGIISARISISIKNKYPVETMKYFDYMFSEEGTRLVAYGVEGLHHKMVDGKPIYTDQILKNPDGFDPEVARIKDGINWTMLPYQIGWASHMQAMKAAAPWTVKGWELYSEPGLVEAPFPTLKLTLDEISKRSQITTEMNTYKDPMIDKFIMGLEPLSKFDEFVANINKAGLQELLKLNNEAYIKYKKLGAK